MNVALLGYGRMGHLLEKVAQERSIKVGAIIDPQAPEADQEITPQNLREVEVCIDFSAPQAVLGNVQKVSEIGKSMVVGTTGWYDSLQKVKKLVEEREIGFIYSPNFSLGMNLFFRITEKTAHLFDAFSDYDVFVLEKHHKNKADSPSGTAQKIGEILIENLERKNGPVYEKLDRKIREDELHIVSVRGGSVKGEHEVTFDCDTEAITLHHQAKSRKSFASGALLAAEWIKNKQGFFTFDEVLQKILEEEDE